MRDCKRVLIAVGLTLVPMIPADMLLHYLELPEWLNIIMMSALGWMMGTEVRKWFWKNDK